MCYDNISSDQLKPSPTIRLVTLLVFYMKCVGRYEMCSLVDFSLRRPKPNKMSFCIANWRMSCKNVPPARCSSLGCLVVAWWWPNMRWYSITSVNILLHTRLPVAQIEFFNFDTIISNKQARMTKGDPNYLTVWMIVGKCSTWRQLV